MPSPIGHALGGIAVGWLVDPPPLRDRGSFIQMTVAFAAAAALPDLDLLFATHRGPTHGVGAAVIAGVVAFAITRRLRSAVALALAYGSHIVFDWLGTDTKPPIGLMALWPLSREYYESSYHLFMAVSRRYWLPEFWAYNLRVLMRELLVFVPAVVLAALGRRYFARSSSRPIGSRQP